MVERMTRPQQIQQLIDMYTPPGSTFTGGMVCDNTAHACPPSPEAQRTRRTRSYQRADLTAQTLTLAARLSHITGEPEAAAALTIAQALTGSTSEAYAVLWACGFDVARAGDLSAAPTD